MVVCRVFVKRGINENMKFIIITYSLPTCKFRKHQFKCPRFILILHIKKFPSRPTGGVYEFATCTCDVLCVELFWERYVSCLKRWRFLHALGNKDSEKNGLSVILTVLGFFWKNQHVISNLEIGFPCLSFTIV